MSSVIEYELSPDWPEEWRVYLPNVYLMDYQLSHSMLYPQSSPQVPEIKLWTIKDEDGLLIHQKENFPPNDILYGWDGTTDGIIEDGYSHRE